jgi:hypothetical protein
MESAWTGYLTGVKVQPGLEASRVTVSPSSAKTTAEPAAKVGGVVPAQVVPLKYETGYGVEGWRVLAAVITTPGDGPGAPTFRRLSDVTT